MPDNRRPSESAWEQGLSRTFYVQGTTPENTVISVVGLNSSVDKGDRAPLLTGRLIDNKYRLLSLLGEGGMGAVYRAHHQALDKEVALKTFLHSEIDEQSRMRFEQEVKAIARLTNKNIVQVYDFGISREFSEASEQQVARPFYTMELLQGLPLSAFIAAADLAKKETVIEVLEIFAQVASGLAYAHKMGIVHRDIKPDNIFICRATGQNAHGSGVVKIVDFGIAKIALADSSDSFSSQSKTQLGLIFGSPLYMSPEQSMGQATDARTDIYSFGCALFQALTGQPPFFGNSSMATIMAHQTQPAPKISDLQPAINWPRRLEGLVASLLQKNKERRAQSFENVGMELMDVIKTLEKSDQFFLSADSGPSHDHDHNDDAQSPGPNARPGAFAVLSLIAIIVMLCGGIYYLFLNKPKPAATAAPTYVHTFDSPQVIGKKDTQEVHVGHYLQGRSQYMQVFVFPHLEYSLGQIGRRKKFVAADGRVEISAKNIYFEAGGEVLKHPMYFSGFGPNDLYGVLFSPQVEPFTDSHMEQVSQLYGLKHLSIDNCLLTVKSLGYFNRLTDLYGLELYHLAFDSKYWPQIKSLSSVQRLGLDHCANMKAVLKKLVEGNKVENITLYFCVLDNEDLRLISQLKSLTYLHFSGGSGLTPQNFKLLARLPRLEHLEVDGGFINMVDFDSLDNMPALRKCKIFAGDLSDAAIERYETRLKARHIDAHFTKPLGQEDF